MSLFSSKAAATTEIYPLSLHDALPISSPWRSLRWSRPCPTRSPEPRAQCGQRFFLNRWFPVETANRSEEHTSELQSHSDLVCRLLLEKKNNNITNTHSKRT